MKGSIAFVVKTVWVKSPPHSPPPLVVDPVQEMHSVFNIWLSFPPSVHCYEFL